jgi:hypothetical protein
MATLGRIAPRIREAVSRKTVFRKTMSSESFHQAVFAQNTAFTTCCSKIEQTGGAPRIFRHNVTT